MEKTASPRRDFAGKARVILFAVVVAAATYLLAVAPMRTYFNERSQMQQAAHRYNVLSDANKQLQARADQLQSNAEVETLARQEYELAPPGQEAFAVMPPPPNLVAAPPAPKHQESFWGHAWDDVTFWN